MMRCHRGTGQAGQFACPSTLPHQFTHTRHPTSTAWREVPWAISLHTSTIFHTIAFTPGTHRSHGPRSSGTDPFTLPHYDIHTWYASVSWRAILWARSLGMAVALT